MKKHVKTVKRSGITKDLLVPLKDERLVKAPGSPYIFFSSERTNTNDYKGMNPKTRVNLIAKEWKALSTAEKKVSLTYSWIRSIC